MSSYYIYIPFFLIKKIYQESGLFVECIEKLGTGFIILTNMKPFSRRSPFFFFSFFDNVEYPNLHVMNHYSTVILNYECILQS